VRLISWYIVDYNIIMSVEYDRWSWRRFRTVSCVMSVRGWCTVWHRWPHGYRLNSSFERACSDVAERIRWGLEESKRVDPEEIGGGK
jgi:hypothetical protein